jgi:hypothetical protein
VILNGCGDLLQQEEEEGIGDVDLFSLAADNTELTVNAKWLQHLQVCFTLKGRMRQDDAIHCIRSQDAPIHCNKLR